MRDLKPHPLELGPRIVAAIDQQKHAIVVIATLFSVSERYVYQLLKLRCGTHDLSPLPHGSSSVAKLDEARLLKLAELVAEVPMRPLTNCANYCAVVVAFTFVSIRWVGLATN